MSETRIGVDLGGTKIEAAALDKNNRIVCRYRSPTPQQDYQRTIQEVSNLVQRIQSEIGDTLSVGVGIPGSLSPKTGLVRNANSTCLIGKPLKNDLEAALKMKVRISNDANCFALSEAIDGSGKDFGSVFGVILGTGVGGGIVLNKKLWQGSSLIAGEWGHIRLPVPDGMKHAISPCYCGRYDCVETHLSGPSLEKQYRDATGEFLQATEIAELAEAGNQQAAKIMEVYEDKLALALAQVVNILDPDCIILGGGLSKISNLYPSVSQKISQHVFSDYTHVCILPPKFGDSSGVRGAAWLWEKDEFCPKVE